jgi:histidine triad (HIT) family protein
MEKKKPTSSPAVPVLDALKKAAQGLRYTSETDAPLEAFAWETTGPLSPERLLESEGADEETPVEEITLEDFVYSVPPEDKATFDVLAKTLKGLLKDIKVFKVGEEAEKDAFIVGTTSDGKWAGLRTVVVET